MSTTQNQIDPSQVPSLSIGDAAARLGIDPTTVRRLIRAGKLVAYRYGLHYRFAPADIAACLAASREAAKDGGGK